MAVTYDRKAVKCGCKRPAEICYWISLLLYSFTALCYGHCRV